MLVLIPSRALVRAATVALALAAILVLPASALALANRGDQIIRQCLATDHISGSFSQGDYNYALTHLPADVDEYSDCRQVIERAKLAAAAGQATNPTGASGRTDPLAGATPGERQAVSKAQHDASPVSVGGQLIRPGVIALRASSIFHTLPAPLLIALIALLAGSLFSAAPTIRRLVRARRTG